MLLGRNALLGRRTSTPASCLRSARSFSGRGIALLSALDSSRYFVLRIQDSSDRHAFIGTGINERNEAFDFNFTLSDYYKYSKREGCASGKAQMYGLGLDNTPAAEAETRRQLLLERTRKRADQEDEHDQYKHNNSLLASLEQQGNNKDEADEDDDGHINFFRSGFDGNPLSICELNTSNSKAIIYCLAQDRGQGVLA
eukprot:jgi/Chlat1/1819/Chrsp138S08689